MYSKFIADLSPPPLKNKDMGGGLPADCVISSTQACMAVA